MTLAQLADVIVQPVERCLCVSLCIIRVSQIIPATCREL